MNNDSLLPLEILSSIEGAIAHMHKHNMRHYQLAYIEPGSAPVLAYDGSAPPEDIPIQRIQIERISYELFTVKFPNVHLTFVY